MPKEQVAQAYDLFRATERSVVFGAFSAVRRQTLDEWNEHGMLRARFADDRCTAALVARSNTRRAHLEDFRRQTTATIRPGDAVVLRVAAEPCHWHELAWMLARLPVSGRTFVSIFQEHPAERSMIEELGWQLAAVKIRSTAEIVGVYCSRGDAHAYSALDVAGIAPTALSYDPSPLVDEIEQLDTTWTNHYSYYNKRESWSALALRSYGGDETCIVKPSEMTSAWRSAHANTHSWDCVDTPLADKLPACRALSEQVGGELQRVRLMRLTAGGGELARHTDLSDVEHGTSDGQIMRLHFPIVTSERVRFGSWSLDGVCSDIQMTAGRGWYLDVRKPHTAVNEGESDRVHLVVDVHASAAVRSLVDV